MNKSISPFASLAYQDFRLFWVGSSVSQIGTQMQTVAIAWQLYQLTHNPISLGLLGLFGFLPILFFGFLGGLTADKFDRKSQLIISQVVQGILAAVLGIETYLGLVTPELIYGLMFLSTAAQTFAGPARQSIIPHLIPGKHFMNAVSLATLSRQAAIVIGPGVAGFLIELYGVQSIYAINAVTFIILILTLIPIKEFERQREHVAFNFKSIMDGIRFVKNSPIISSSMLLDFFATFFASAAALMPIFATDILKTGARGLGLLYAAPSVGGVLAGLLLSSIRNLKHQGKIMIGAVLIYGLATIGFGLSRSLPLTLFFLFWVGAGDMVSTIIRNTARQVVTPDYMRGRMVSINMIFLQGGPKLGDVEAGLLAAALGAPLSVVIGGIGAITATLIVAKLFPHLRRYQGKEVAV